MCPKLKRVREEIAIIPRYRSGMLFERVDRMNLAQPAGFSLVELMIVAGLIAVLAAMSGPVIQAGMARYALISASQQVASTIRAARFQAVAKNRTLRVRFNCPSAGQYRVVEFIGTAVDTAANRCDSTAYPFPAADTDPATLPNLDGALQLLPTGAEFGALSDIEIDTSGRMIPLTGCPTCVAAAPPATIVVGNGDEDQDRTITVSASGRVQLD